jgi:hypothetical protein
MSQDVKAIAFYLPQFHPTPENDLWWGKGFTEWTNVTKAKPLFDGHYQPHLPTDLGFYDLRLKKTRLEQISMAKRYGISGFCYHYYWFSGKKILNETVDAMLADSDHDMPFCLNWANENWTRRWDAADHEVLIAQEYLPSDNLNFIKSLEPFFKDPRYIRIDGKPLLMVYRPQHLPNTTESIEVWRRYCLEVGIGEIYICCALTHGNRSYTKYGFDGGIEFPPHNLEGIAQTEDHTKFRFYEDFGGMVCDYKFIAETYMDRKYDDPNVFKSVFPSWDNAARTGHRAFIALNGTPANYEYWLKRTVDQTLIEKSGDERLVFINAWNEWAEGCHLEPDRKYGHQFLEATKRVMEGNSSATKFENVGQTGADQHSSDELLKFLNDLQIKSLRDPALWIGHLPFIAWLIRVSKPETILEIGTGDDLNFASLIHQNSSGLNYEPVLLCYPQKTPDATFLKRTLEIKEALPRSAFFDNDFLTYGDGNSQYESKIDLVHINDVRSAKQLNLILAKVLPLLSQKGVVLVNNINWIDLGIDVHTAWIDLKLQYPSFSFLYSHGLGVLLVGNDQPKMMLRLAESEVSNSELKQARLLFQLAGKILDQGFALARNSDGFPGDTSPTPVAAAQTSRKSVAGRIVDFLRGR